jgi:RNA polymerase sigma factor (sigma-70 family)
VTDNSDNWNDMDDQNSFNLIRQGGKMRDLGVASLYRSHAAHFRKFYKYHGLNEADAEDIAHETFIKIVRHCDSYNGESPLAAWLWSIARNCMNDHFRRIKVRIQTGNSGGNEGQDGDEEPEIDGAPDEGQYDGAFDAYIKHATIDCVQRAFAEFNKSFPDRALALSLWNEGYDTSEISAAIHRNLGATREYISQCKKKSETFLQHCREYLSVV